MYLNIEAKKCWRNLFRIILKQNLCLYILCVCMWTVFLINHSKNTSFNYLYKRQILKVISCLAETVRTQLWFNYFEVTVTFGEIPNTKYDLILIFPENAFVKTRLEYNIIGNDVLEWKFFFREKDVSNNLLFYNMEKNEMEYWVICI